MELDYTGAYVLAAIAIVAGSAFVISLGLPWWGTAGGIVLVVIWAINKLGTGQVLHSLLRK